LSIWLSLVVVAAGEIEEAAEALVVSVQAQVFL
jgi:hypothetical protein